MYQIEKVPVGKLVKSDINPRTIKPQEFRALCESIKTDPAFMECRPILCDENYVIYAGHQRLEACKVLGWTEVPVIVTPGLTDDEKKRRMLIDNKNNGEFVAQKLLDNFEKVVVEDILGSDIFKTLEVKEKEFNPDKLKLYDQMEIKGFENYDYLVFIFKNLPDFQNACQKFGVEKVDTAMVRGKTQRIGIGRVLDGRKLLG